MKHETKELIGRLVDGLTAYTAKEIQETFSKLEWISEESTKEGFWFLAGTFLAVHYGYDREDIFPILTELAAHLFDNQEPKS